MKYNVVKKLGSGSVGDGYLLEDGKAIIVGKREDSFSTYKTMFNKMQVVNGKITTVNYPKVYSLIPACLDYPFGAIIEECILGEELRTVVSNLSIEQKNEIGKVLGKFIAELHSITVNGNKEQEIDINLNKYDKSLAILKEHLTNDVYCKLAELKQVYKNMLVSKQFCLTHGDLNAGNIMVAENGEISGVIDFGNMEFYIPEIEFVHMYFFDSVIYNSMVKNYPRKIDDKEVVFLELVVNIRHFKNIKNFEDRKTNCLKNINALLNKFLEM